MDIEDPKKKPVKTTYWSATQDNRGCGKVCKDFQENIVGEIEQMQGDSICRHFFEWVGLGHQNIQRSVPVLWVSWFVSFVRTIETS